MQICTYSEYCDIIEAVIFFKCWCFRVNAHPDALFAEQIVFCVVQQELVDAVISIVLGRKAIRGEKTDIKKSKISYLKKILLTAKVIRLQVL